MKSPSSGCIITYKYTIQALGLHLLIIFDDTLSNDFETYNTILTYKYICPYKTLRCL